MNELRDDYILPSYSPLTLFVNNATDLQDPHRNARIREMIAEFEKEPLNLGPPFTHFWLRDFDKFMVGAPGTCLGWGSELLDVVSTIPVPYTACIPDLQLLI